MAPFMIMSALLATLFHGANSDQKLAWYRGMDIESTPYVQSLFNFVNSVQHPESAVTHYGKLEGKGYTKHVLVTRTSNFEHFIQIFLEWSSSNRSKQTSFINKANTLVPHKSDPLFILEWNIKKTESSPKYSGFEDDWQAGGPSNKRIANVIYDHAKGVYPGEFAKALKFKHNNLRDLYIVLYEVRENQTSVKVRMYIGVLISCGLSQPEILVKVGVDQALIQKLAVELVYEFEMIKWDTNLAGNEQANITDDVRRRLKTGSYASHGNGQELNFVDHGVLNSPLLDFYPVQFFIYCLVQNKIDEEGSWKLVPDHEDERGIETRYFYVRHQVVPNGVAEVWIGKIFSDKDDAYNDAEDSAVMLLWVCGISDSENESNSTVAIF